MDSGPTTTQSPSSGSTRISGISAAPPIIPFTSVDELFDLLESTTGDCVQVNQVSVGDFRAVQRLRDSRCRKFRFFYDSRTTCPIVTLPRLPHEVLHTWLDSRIGIKADAMGMGDQLDPTGSATFESTSGGDLGTSLEGDSSWIPVSRMGADCWPVLVIEASCSQSMEQLRTKARAWFSVSNLEVKIVILAKMFASDARIVLEKWKGVQAGGCVHTIEISRPGIANEDPRSVSPESYRVSRAALSLEFEDLFLRSADGEEADIVITEEELQLFASRVWARSS